MTIRIAFLGTPVVAVPPLRALAGDDRVEVAVVVTNPDRPQGRSRTPRPPPVKVAAEDLGIEVWQPQRASAIAEGLRGLRLDAAAVVAYGALLRPDVLASVRTGFVNLHYSLLPRWRGAAPVQHAIAAGDEETGLTTFVIDEGMDTGPVLATHRLAIPAEATSGDLLEQLTAVGAQVLVDSVVGLVDGSLVPQPQPTDGVTSAPKITPDDVEIDWRLPAARVSALVRSANPRPGAHTTWRGQRCKVWFAHPAESAESAAAGAGEPGEVVASGSDGPVVACGDGSVVLRTVQPAGRPRQDGRDFVNGQHPAAGERFGS